MKRCKDCKWWVKTSMIPNDPNPSGKCNGRWNGKYEGYGIHAYTPQCNWIKNEKIDAPNW